MGLEGGAGGRAELGGLGGDGWWKEAVHLGNPVPVTEMLTLAQVRQNNLLSFKPPDLCRSDFYQIGRAHV